MSQERQAIALTGENDHSLERIREVHQAMTAKGLDCRLRVEAGLGHEFPPDFDVQLATAVEDILGR